ncbi:ATP-binding protein [Candidatus Chlorohelix sp.]|uniref:ATP-binding protein n=1 Tax=Candidatus Chlorohelix sp. TaxID=3139201 RepID=UPI003048F0C3
MDNEPSLESLITSDNVDLTNCDREPIHIPGNIQPHGVLLVLKEPELTIIQISSNSYQHLGLHPTELLNKPISVILKKNQLNYLQASLKRENYENNPLYIFTLKVQGQVFDSLVHRIHGVLVLELEPSKFVKAGNSPDLYNHVKSMFSSLSSNMTVREFCQVVTEHVQNLTGFDRVVVYKFDDEGRGEVLAESIGEGISSFLGLHYPASDIPKQARALYMLNWLRLICNVDYTPAPLTPILNPVTAKPLDMSYSVLRSVSPIHIEYLKNMGVKASMSISLIQNNHLWGLIACHHESPKFVPYELRTACELMGQIISLQLSTREENEDFEYRLQIKEVHARLIEQLSMQENYIDRLLNYNPNLSNLINAGGVAVCLDGSISKLGETPDNAQIAKLVNWLSDSVTDDIFSSNCLSKEYSEAQKFKDISSGLLSVAIVRSQKHFILWFRPEIIQTVNWGGNPNKPMEISDDGERLLPRKSFELWKETVQLTSQPWLDCEINAARELKDAIVNIILLRQANELARLNRDLEQSNIELDAFSYIASHDLKEPLRGMHNYSNILLADYANQIDQDGKDKLKTLARLTQRMEGLLDSLLYFSRVGRIDFSVSVINLDEVVHQTLDILSARLEQDKVEVRLPRPLPIIKCDKVRLGEVYNNLISNAIKYNNKLKKWIEIGYFAPGEQTNSNQKLADYDNSYIFYVKDNGIGIRAKHLESIFQIFKRLHARDQFGGGTGAGLTITKKIIERHGGEIWAESEFGEGSTFYFTLHSRKLK